MLSDVTALLWRHSSLAATILCCSSIVPLSQCSVTEDVLMRSVVCDVITLCDVILRRHCCTELCIEVRATIMRLLFKMVQPASTSSQCSQTARVCGLLPRRMMHCITQYAIETFAMWYASASSMLLAIAFVCAKSAYGTPLCTTVYHTLLPDSGREVSERCCCIQLTHYWQ